MTSKFCRDCEQVKNACEFNKSNNKSGLSTYCKKCAAMKWKIFYTKEKERLAQKAKDRYWNGGREKSLIVSKTYHYSHQEKINKRSQEYAKTHKQTIKAQRAAKKDELNEYQRDYSRNRAKTDPLFKFKKNIRRSTSEAFSLGKKSNKTIELLGCSLEQAFIHIESLFKPGMTWDNYGPEWHIDHIIPLASATTIKEVEKLCHYTNLQPLWALENILKSNKLNWNPLVA